MKNDGNAPDEAVESDVESMGEWSKSEAESGNEGRSSQMVTLSLIYFRNVKKSIEDRSCH